MDPANGSDNVPRTVTFLAPVLAPAAPISPSPLAFGDDQQPQAPPQHSPPPAPAGADSMPPPRPVTATVDSSLTVSACPRGHVAGAEESRIERLTSNVSPHERHR
jgi:hypothetical protein